MDSGQGRRGPSHDFLDQVIGEETPINAYSTPEYIKDIGTPERYVEVSEDWSAVG